MASLELGISSIAAVAFVSGVLIHHCLFIHGEWHIQAPTIAASHAGAFLLIFAFQSSIGSDSITHNVVATTIVATAYLWGLLLSISVYRLLFHRLRRFPGPRLAALSKLWHVWKCRDSRNHHLLESLHQKYGTFVRTGQ